MDLVEIRDGNAITPLRDEWEQLLALSERATIYQTWEWNEAWWRAFGKGKRLRLLAMRENDALVGLAPLYVSRHLGTPLRRLAFLGTGPADYLDVIASVDRAPEVCGRVLHHLAHARGFDLADLQQLRPEAGLRTAFECHRPTRNPIHISSVPQEVCPSLPLPASWDEYAARLSKSMRYHISRHEKALVKGFGSVEIRLATAEELPEAMAALFELHQQRWNARLLPGVLGSAQTQDFHREIASRFQERGWLRLYIARLDGRIAAALYCFRFRERHYYYLGGFAPELGKYSLGTVLMAHAIRQAIAEGCTAFDFLRGGEAYKCRWLPEERLNHRLLLARPRSVRSHAMLRLNRLERYVEVKAKAFAESRGRSSTK